MPAMTSLPCALISLISCKLSTHSHRSSLKPESPCFCHLNHGRHLCVQGEPASASAAGQAEHARAADHKPGEQSRQENETVQGQTEPQKLEGRVLHEHQALEEVCRGHIHILNVYGFS